MTNVRTQSITNGQIGQINDRLATKLRESGLPSEAVQRVLKMPGNAAIDELVAVFCKHVEAQSSIIIRHVRVARLRTPRQVLDATGRKQYINRGVVDAMLKDGRDEDDVFFFRPDESAYKNGLIGGDDLAKEYELRGLKPDPYAQAAVNEVDPAFADEHPNSTHWKDADGNWCYVAFGHRYGGERDVDVGRSGNGWYDNWFFAGVRK